MQVLGRTWSWIDPNDVQGAVRSPHGRDLVVVVAIGGGNSGPHRRCDDRAGDGGGQQLWDVEPKGSGAHRERHDGLRKAGSIFSTSRHDSNAIGQRIRPTWLAGCSRAGGHSIPLAGTNLGHCLPLFGCLESPCRM